MKIEETKNAQILIMGEAIRFSILESSHKVPPKEPRPKYSYHDYDYEPSGILQIQLEDVPYDMDGQKAWRDSKTKKLEQILNSVMAGMVLCAAWRKERQEYWRLQKIKDEIARKKREEEERQKALDKRRATLFGEDCQKWQQYKQLSEYFGQIKATYSLPEHLADEEFQK